METYLKLRIVDKYGHDIVETDDIVLIAEVLARTNVTPEQKMIMELKRKLEAVESKLNTTEYYKNQAEKKLKELQAT